MSGNKTVYEVDQDTMDKINDVFDFVRNQKSRIEKNTETWLTTKEAAKYLKISAVTLLMLAKEGTIPCSGTVKRKAFHINDLDEYRRKRKGYGDDLDEFKGKREGPRASNKN